MNQTEEVIDAKIRGVSKESVSIIENNTKRRRTLSVEDEKLVNELENEMLPVKKRIVVQGNTLVAIRQN